MTLAFARPLALGELARRLGGTVDPSGAATEPGTAAVAIARVAPVEAAGAGDLAPLLGARYVAAAREALARGAVVLADAALAPRLALASGASGADEGRRVWVHAHAAWALAGVLDLCEAADAPATWGEGTVIGANVTLFPRVVLGKDVTIAPGCVIGAPGFGWASGPGGAGDVRRVPQLGGVVLEDGVSLGALCTIDAGTLGPTRIRRGARLDAQVHVGHNAEVGEGSMLAAQCGLAGSVRIGSGVLVGGQVGIADHVTVGDGARIAAKSGVIGDVPPGAVVAGYPAVPRGRWLRALAKLYRGLAPHEP